MSFPFGIHQDKVNFYLSLYHVALGLDKLNIRDRIRSCHAQIQYLINIEGNFIK